MPSAPLVFGNDASPSASSTSFTSSATWTASAKPTSGDGSRSKSTKSGRSGLSTREYHVFMSMQPMFTIQSSASSSLTSGDVDPPRLRAASRASRPRTARVGIQSGMCFGASFWKKNLPCHAVGVALHRERPVVQVRHEHGRDRAVVGEQVALRDPLVRPEELVEVRELEHALAACGSRSAIAAPRGAPRRAALSSRSPWNDGRAQAAVVRPLDELDLGRRAPARPRRRRPCAPSASSERPGTATSSRSSGRSFASSSLDLLVGEAGADVADVAQLAALVGRRARASRSGRRGGPGPSCSRRSRTPGGRAS